LIWLEKCDHAGYIFNDGYETQVVDAIEDIVKKAKGMW